MWKYFIALPLLAAVKVNIQGYFSKGRTKTLSAVFSLNALIFTAVALSLAALYLRAPFPAEVLLWGAVSGGISAAFQVSYTLAFRCGPVAPATIINNFNIILPLLTGVLCFGERMSALSLIGLVFLAVAFCLIPEKKGGKINGRWLIFTVAAFLASGTNNVLTLFFNRSSVAAYKEAYVIVGYAFAALFCMGLSILFHRKGEETLRIDARLLVGIVAIGVVLGLYNRMLVFAAAEVAAVLLYPVINGLTIFWIALSDRILFRQKFARRQMVGMLCGLAAVILLNL